MLLYFRIAAYYNITDKPNERSSHQEVITRGGGVIYLFAAAIAFVLHPAQWMLVLSLFIAGGVSFVDDWLSLSNKIRILFHVMAATLLFYALGAFSMLAWWNVAMLYILIIGIINAYNFMDGINGITGTYSLVVFAGLQYVNLGQVYFIHPDMIWLPVIASLVFLFFNFRRKAVCFAGDVGSVTVACWVLFILLSLIFKTGNWSYLLFLVVYGVDSVLTIIHRMLLRQNIFEAHRMHFYQLLVNEQNIPHLFVALGYAIVQLGVIIFLINHPSGFFINCLITILPLVVIYISFKPFLMHPKKAQKIV